MSNEKFFSSTISRYLLLGIMLVFLITAFGLELSRTNSKCNVTATTSGGTFSAKCDASNLCLYGVIDASQSIVSTDDNGNSYTINFKVSCAWSTPTTALNYVAFGLAVIFGLLFSRVKGLKNLSLVAAIVVGSLAAASMITSVGLQANDINKGNQIISANKAANGSSSGLSLSVFLANVIFSALTFLMLVLGTVHAGLEHKRKSSTEASSAQTMVKVNA